MEVQRARIMEEDELVAAYAAEAKAAMSAERASCSQKVSALHRWSPAHIAA